METTRKATIAETISAPPHITKGPLPATVVPPAFRVTAVYFDSNKRYRTMGDWLVMTRCDDYAVGHRFNTEAEARAFAATEIVYGPLGPAAEENDDNDLIPKGL